MGPKFKDKCPDKRYPKDRYRDKRGGHVKTEKLCSHKPSDTLGPPETRGGKEGFPLEPSEGAQP